MKTRILSFFLFAMLPNVAASQTLNYLVPRPKASFERRSQSFSYSFYKTTKIVIPDNPTPATKKAIDLLQKYIKKTLGDTLVTVVSSVYNDSAAIIIGEPGTNPALDKRLPFFMPPGEVMPGAQGYIIDVGSYGVLIAGSDPEGTFNAVATFNQIMIRGLSGCHIWDEPDYPIRWVFLPQHLRSAQSFAKLKSIADTMAFYKLNGGMHSEFDYNILYSVPGFFYDSLALWKKIADERNIEIIPAVANIGWSSGILFNDPNLATGIPAEALYMMESDSGRLIPDPAVSLPNGGFESLSGGQFTGWSFYDGPNISTFADSTVFHSGTKSVRCTTFVAGNPAGNCRFNRKMNCKPWHYYTISAWVKTEDYIADMTQLLAIGQDAGGTNSQTLTYTSFSIPQTTDVWIKVEARFNTLSNTQLLLYCGTWGGKKGTIWWDDFDIQEAGMCNILRRAGTPLHVKNKNTGAEYKEGIDFQPVSDPILNAGHGNYGRFHTGPTVHRIASGAMHNGDSLLITFSHPVTCVADIDNNGSVMCSLSEDTLYQMLTYQAKNLKQLLSPKRYFMSHDEIRVMNWDSSDQRRNSSPRGILGDNINRCDSIFKDIGAGAERFIWSDMIDSTHNAVNNYYLLNGDLRGIWNDVPKSLIVTNWNYGSRDASLNFFSKLGFRQISSPYYDVGNLSTIRNWRLSMDTVAGVLGSMYTTWADDYRFLAGFAGYYWSAGPFITHVPLDASVLKNSSFTFKGTVSADPYSAGSSITSIVAEIYDTSGVLQKTVPLIVTGTDFSATTPNDRPEGFRYRIVAKNDKSLWRKTPLYRVSPSDDITFPNVNLLSPANHSKDTVHSVRFVWNSIKDVVKYELFVEDTSTFFDSITRDTAMTVNGFKTGQKYYWTVYAYGMHDTTMSTDFFSFTVVPTNGVRENNTEDSYLKIYPNPSSHDAPARIEYHIDKRQKVHLYITNVLGSAIKEIFSGELAGDTYLFGLEKNSLARGTYVAVLETEGQRLTVQFVVE